MSSSEAMILDTKVVVYLTEKKVHGFYFILLITFLNQDVFLLELVHTGIITTGPTGAGISFHEYFSLFTFRSTKLMHKWI